MFAPGNSDFCFNRAAESVSVFVRSEFHKTFQLFHQTKIRCDVALFGFVGNIVGPALGPIIIAALTDYVFHDPRAVGLALGLATLVITPTVGMLLWLGLAPFRDSLSRADGWAGAELAQGSPAP